MSIISSASAPQTAGGVAAILGSSTPVGAVIDTAVSLFGFLGIKGATKHLSYDAVNPVAARFSDDTANILTSNFGRESFNVVAPLAAKHFLDEMQKNWGFGTGLNQTIAQDVGGSGQRGDLGRLLWLFCIWVGTNIDQAMPDTFHQYMRDEFTAIFLAAYNDAGYNISKLNPDYIAPAISVSEPYKGNTQAAYIPPPSPPSPTPSQAGFPMIAGIVLVGAGIGWYFMKGGR